MNKYKNIYISSFKKGQCLAEQKFGWLFMRREDGSIAIGIALFGRPFIIFDRHRNLVSNG